MTPLFWLSVLGAVFLEQYHARVLSRTSDMSRLATIAFFALLGAITVIYMFNSLRASAKASVLNIWDGAVETLESRPSTVLLSLLVGGVIGFLAGAVLT